MKTLILNQDFSAKLGRVAIQTLVTLLALLTFLSLSTCGDSPVTPDPDPDPQPGPTGTVNFFPNSRNVNWTYELFDSLSTDPPDTITITIRGTRLLQQTGNVVRVWETFHTATDSTDTTFVRVVGDSVQFYDSDLASTRHRLIHLPLFEDQRWENPSRFIKDSGGVFSIDSVSVPAGDFPIAVQVINGWFANFTIDGIITTTWVVDSIGIVQQQTFNVLVIGTDTTIFENIGWKLLNTNQIESE